MLLTDVSELVQHRAGEGSELYVASHSRESYLFSDNLLFYFDYKSSSFSKRQKQMFIYT